MKTAREIAEGLEWNESDYDDIEAAIYNGFTLLVVSYDHWDGRYMIASIVEHAGGPVRSSAILETDRCLLDARETAVQMVMDREKGKE